jgi:hypothetical protein
MDKNDLSKPNNPERKPKMTLLPIPLLLIGACIFLLFPLIMFVIPPTYPIGPVVVQMGVPTSEAYLTRVYTRIPEQTPNATQTIQATFREIDYQLETVLRSNIAFNRLERMKQDDTVDVELLLSPSLMESELATQIVERRSLATSTAEPGVLIAPGGQVVSVETGQVEITPLMKAVLISADPEAFVIVQIHDSAEQAISTTNATTWRWSVTAKKKGAQRMELVIYRLIKYDGKEYWREVETYKAEIAVEVTPLQQLQTWDWQWIASAVLIPLVIALWSWWRNRNKKPEPVPGDPLRGRMKRNRN